MSDPSRVATSGFGHRRKPTPSQAHWMLNDSLNVSDPLPDDR
jgi:hypothetical protein